MNFFFTEVLGKLFFFETTLKLKKNKINLLISIVHFNNIHSNNVSEDLFNSN